MKVTASICADRCVFAIEENHSGFCRNPEAKHMMKGAWAPLCGFECPYFFTLEEARAMVLFRAGEEANIRDPRLRDLLDSFGVPHQLNGDHRVYDIEETRKYLSENQLDDSTQNVEKVELFLFLLKQKYTTHSDSFTVRRPAI